MSNRRTPKHFRRRPARSRWTVLQLQRQVAHYGIPGLTAHQQSVYQTIMSFADDYTGQAAAAIDRIVIGARCSRRTVQRSIRVLVALGLISYAEGYTAGGRGRKSRFRVEKQALADYLNQTIRPAVAVAEQARRDATTITAAAIGNARSRANKLRHRELDKGRQRDTHSPLTRLDTPPVRAGEVGNDRPEHWLYSDEHGLSCRTCQLPADHPVHLR